jgi:hypothetical protein
MYLKFGCSGKKTVGLRRGSSRGKGEGQYQVYTNNDLGTAFLNPAAFFEVPFEHRLYSGLCFWHIFSAAALSRSSVCKWCSETMFPVSSELKCFTIQE